MSTKLLLQFNNSFHDGSGNERGITTSGYFAFTDSGPFGYGLEPKIGKVDVADSTDWQIGSGDFTVDFWA
ncbi:MAG TPA: hypothetical protein PKK48_07800, partial [Phycisphaerae bacterium]|nr:hypothetical protein [Phycisphaerae bacterium]